MLKNSYCYLEKLCPDEFMDIMEKYNEKGLPTIDNFY